MELLEESMQEAVVRMSARFGPSTAVCQKDVYAKYNCEKVYVFAKNFASMEMVDRFLELTLSP